MPDTALDPNTFITPKDPPKVLIASGVGKTLVVEVDLLAGEKYATRIIECDTPEQAKKLVEENNESRRGWDMDREWQAYDHKGKRVK